jgi:glycine cleavage system H protein
MVTLPAHGAVLRALDLVAEIQYAEARVKVRSPVAGSVVLVNERLLEQPDLVGTDPFNAGWLFEVQLAYDETLEHVMDVDSYLRGVN